jgi:bifunctional ADP-heptose synthase (sugar kinase/adenylyltransferase)
MKVLVVGDKIVDQYMHCKAVRLSPEAPIPVHHKVREETKEGGAALVGANLVSLLGNDSVLQTYGSVSHKYRYFSDRTLLFRWDNDSYTVLDPKHYWDNILRLAEFADIIAVSDYGKGAITPSIASGLLGLQNKGKLLFVDAKHEPERYRGCFALFPNEHEHNGLNHNDYLHVIRKLGSRGCMVDGHIVPTEEQQVYDVSGAGDCFLAGFLTAYCRQNLTGLNGVTNTTLIHCAEYANRVAGVSVRFLGTHVVKPSDL